MREATYPKAGRIFQHKENADSFARVLYPAEGRSIDEREEITEAEYEAKTEKEEAKMHGLSERQIQK